ncbi:hypothetical protein RP726_06110 [Candidatus Methylospira mobilis]|uniref:transposase n=1 Tax=Candidatus Methylospira mobilis TaxID=1808979 RepID=UPI001D179DD4|nr:transposase [Candidatus Methylospira mobilis]WNV05986.1 hypothetical protein RP726_06110 [Candidatus Methylospira mobilis]
MPGIEEFCEILPDAKALSHVPGRVRYNADEPADKFHPVSGKTESPSPTGGSIAVTNMGVLGNLWAGIGQVHKFGTQYLANYANEAAYREDTRRWSNGAIFSDITAKCAKTRTHHDWCGYWQGNKRREERLAA